jgi:hypothetical protein
MPRKPGGSTAWQHAYSGGPLNVVVIGGAVTAIEVVSPFPPDECAARLLAAIDQEGFLSWRGSRPVIGRVSGRSVRLRKRIRYRSSFQTFLTGTLEPQGEGSVFRGTAGMHPFVPIFMAIWFAGVGIAWVGTALVAAIQGLLGAGGQPAGVVILTSVMMAFGVALVCAGRLLARGEEPFLVAFVADVLAARSEADD